MNPKDIQIALERPDQSDVLALLSALDHYLGQLYPSEANHLLDPAALLAPEVSFHVARSQGRVVATGAVRRMAGGPDTQGEAYGEVKRMVVDPAWRRLGVAARMLAELERSLREAGLKLALLETGAAQTEAVGLYERCGYRRRHAFGGYPDNGLSLFYAKRLD